MIVTDGDRVLQIITNLLANAFRWTPDGGRIGLELSARTATCRSRSRTRARGSPRTSGSGSSGRSLARRLRRHGPRPRDRARARARRSAAGSTSRASPGRGSRFELVLPAEARASAGARRRPRPVARAFFDPVDDRSGAASERLLEPREPVVDALPAGREQVDEQARGRRRAHGARRAMSPSMPLEAADGWFIRPRTSASWRATGRASARRRRWTASPTCAGSVASSSAAAAGERLEPSRARSSAASTSAGVDAPLGRPLRAAAARARSRPDPSEARLTLADGCRPRELDYELPPELIAQRPPERRDESPAARLRPGDAATVRHRRFGDLPEELRGELVVVNDTRVVPARLHLDRRAARRGAAARAAGTTGVGGARAAHPAPACRSALRPGRAAGARSARAAGGCGSTASRPARSPLPPYITTPLDDPERYQTVYAREPGLGGGADRRAALHARAARRARRRARDAARRARHVPPGRGRRRSRTTRCTASATTCGPRRGSGSAPPSACSRSGRRRCACSRRSRAALR